MRQARTCGRVRAPGQTPSASKLWKSLNPCQCKVATDEIQERKKLERSNKSVRVSALTGSVPRKMAEGRHRVEAFVGIKLLSPNSLLLALTTKP